MPSLSTVYFVSIMIASVAGIGSAFVGNMIHPIKGGADYVPPTPGEVAKATAEAERATNEADKKAQELRDAEPFQKAKQEVPTVRPPENLPAVTAVRSDEENDAKQLEEAVKSVESAPSANSLLT